MEIKIINTQKMLNEAFKIREIVFVDEQKVPLKEEIDEYETSCIHFLVYNKNNEAIATCRTRDYHDKKIKIERVCVLKAYRGLKIGEKLITFAEQEAKKHGYKTAILAAQIQASNFYKKIGYQICSESFMDASIEHYMMEKLL